MAIALKARRVVTVVPETARGTFVTPNPTNDAIPTIRDGTFTVDPVSVDRPTLRQTLTRYAATYPGVATGSISVTFEMGGLPLNPKTDYDVPVWFDCFRACGFTEVSNLNGGLKPRLLQNVTSLTGGTANTPLRHGETVTGNGGTVAGAGIVVGDFFGEDDVLCVQETTAPTGTALTTWTGATSLRVATGTRGANSVVALRLSSNVNTTECVSAEIYLDGKRLQLKGCMGNAEILLDYGDMIRAKVDLQGVVVTPVTTGYADVALPTTANEVHKVAPTFLGKEVRIYEIGASPKFFGRDSAAGTPTVGAISTIRVNTGNEVILRKNAFDPSGVTNALITGRAPSGSFDPDEVLSTEFDWITKFIQGTPMRFKAMVGSAGTVTTQDGNTVDVLAPGIVLSQMGDTDRDGVNNWNGQFKITGGDYDPSASIETVGADNELVLIYR